MDNTMMNNLHVITPSEPGNNGEYVTLPCSTVSAEHLRLMFRAAMANCPESVNGRQRYVTEEKGGWVFLQIISSFKIKAE